MSLGRREFLGVCALGADLVDAAPKASLAVAELDRGRVLADAAKFLGRNPVTPVGARSPRSAGGAHDFFSEGDYWWPDPKDPQAPYIRRDGITNPANFVEHRNFLMRLSVEVPALTAAWKLTGDKRYAEHAAARLRAWFVTPETRMNPNLQYAQAIHGRSTGRGTGIIDTIHLVEVARAVAVITSALSKSEMDAILQWFADYTAWMTTSKNGIEERDAVNNHGTCWVMQVVAFAKLTANAALLGDCAKRFKTLIVPRQIAPDGSQPLEISRTKPYGYCLFNLEVLATICQILPELWMFETADGRSVRKAIEYMFPFIADKKKWKQQPDVMYFEQWPMRQEALLFGGLAYDRQDYLDLWKRLPASSDVEEVIRNYFIRQPVLWV